jgi:hypothetical protein
VALLEDRGGDVGADLGLRAPGLEELAHAGVHAVDRRTGGAQLGHLGRVLAHPQLPHHRPGEGLLHVGERGAQRQHVRGRHRVGEPDPARAATQVAHEQVGVLPVAPRDDLDPQLVEGDVGEPRCLQARHHQRGRGAVARRGQHQAGEALVGLAGDAQQVAQIRARGDEQQVDVLCGGHLAGTANAVGEERGRNGRCHGREGIPASCAA